MTPIDRAEPHCSRRDGRQWMLIASFLGRAVNESGWGQIRSGLVRRARHSTSQTSLNGISQKRKQLIRRDHGRGHLEQGRVRSLQPPPRSLCQKKRPYSRFFVLPWNKQSRLLYPHDRSDSWLIVKTIMFIRNNYHLLWRFSVSRCHFQLSNTKLLWIIIHNDAFLLLAVTSLSAFAVKKNRRENRDQKTLIGKIRRGTPTRSPPKDGAEGKKSAGIPSKCWLQPSLQVCCWAFVTVKHQVSTLNNHECTNLWSHANPSKEAELAGYERKRGGRSRDDFFSFFFSLTAPWKSCQEASLTGDKWFTGWHLPSHFGSHLPASVLLLTPLPPVG